MNTKVIKYNGIRIFGLWNALTNTPTLASGVGSEGEAYKVSVTGSTTLDGISTWIATDVVYFTQGVWSRIPCSNTSSSAVGAKGDVQFRGNPGQFAASSLFNYTIIGGGGLGNEYLTLGPSGTNLSNNPFSVNGNVNDFQQSNTQNINNGGSASSDMVCTADNGNDNNNYIDVGINSSGYNDPLYSIGQANDGYIYVAGGDISMGTATSNKVIIFHTGGTLSSNERVRITNTQLLAKGQIVSSGGGVGYTTGAGGTVTQLTSRTTTVTLNKLCGVITMFSAVQNNTNLVSFTLNNTFLSSGDFLLMQSQNNTNQASWNFSAVVNNGNAIISVRNVSGSSITEATQIKFVIIKSVQI
jgi:hypothetical protein